MEEEKKEFTEFLVPDYFEAFRCKMGDCRNACCKGWNVSISMKNYFGLLGANCSDELRRKIDCTMVLSERRSEQEYAVLGCSYDGNCKLRSKDGSCALQNELGEEALPDICRLYPRGIRYDSVHGFECSMANSCEKVPELFLSRSAPIEFKRKNIAITVPYNFTREYTLESLGLERELRLYFIKIMQDRTMHLNQRIMMLSLIFGKLEDAFAKRDRLFVESLLEGKQSFEPPTVSEISEDTINNGLMAIERMMMEISERSPTIHGLIESILEKYRNSDSAEDTYFKFRGKFETLYPNWDIFFEHLLVNHMFFTMFPYQDRPESLHDEFCALCTVYSVLRFLFLGSVDDMQNDSSLADNAAAAFRFIEHTDFDRYSAHLMKKLNCSSDEILSSLVSL